LYSGWCVSYKNTYSRTFSINPLNAELNPICHLLALLGTHHIFHISRIRVNFSVNSSATPQCPPGKPVSRTQMSADRRDLDWSAASARLLFDGDDAILHSAFRTPSRRGHRSLPAAAAPFLCGRSLIEEILAHWGGGLSSRQIKKKVPAIQRIFPPPGHLCKKVPRLTISLAGWIQLLCCTHSVDICSTFPFLVLG
jgi:hypothetical protein